MSEKRDPKQRTGVAAGAEQPAAAETDLVAAGESFEPIDAERRRLSERLRDTRDFLGLSQQEAADAAGLTRLAISAIETGRRKVESVELGALARVYGQPIAYFLSSIEVGEGSQPDEMKFIARATRELSAEDRTELLRFAEFLRTYRAPKSTAEGGVAGES